MENSKCKICRRAGEKLFLKGDKCVSQKCPFLRKPYPPGLPPKRRRIRISEYGSQLREAQKLKKIYGIDERHFKKIIKEILKKRGREDVSEILLKRVEKSLLNIIYRVGFAKSRDSAKQLISHSHFLLNGKKVNIPTQEVKIGDEIKLKEKSKNIPYFKNIISLIKPENIPSWLSFDKDKGFIKVVREPKSEEIGVKINIPLVLAFYS
ncbi:MAG: 30S ribosomal protein S4 [Parcubacteria group bacterium CG_4_9_14_0_2_um_filter_35_11]|nr:MAG: 30S ribosomal protein S4 [Parcubacteria group bacterium CG07_land_8_20_14_0_80_35_11]PJC48128.1 MAG: 30S ribosomal protein S4 [Parcubacteria group bacterium CG_4_9_14_0_2_um_filter_35_11]